MTNLELLAPAKNLECGIAAIDHGADAVYIGAPRFGARAAAGNSIDDIRQLCHYAHLFAASVYVTVNTIIYDSELEDTMSLVHELADVGVDAILIQDMGLFSLVSSNTQLLSSISFHASTQTDNRSPEKVRWLRSLGFRRVVLARELSVQEIAQIHREVPDVELEVFVHGALCVSYSGLCYASQHCFSRSANRGACAQFCRMKFDLLDANGVEIEHQRHLLSLKDLNQLNHLDELILAGATSFKIEGRLKDVSYVKNVVAAYNQQLDNIIAKNPGAYQRSSKGHCTYTFTPNLRKTFNRGFTNYFYGLCFIDSNRELQGFRVNRAQGNRLFPQQMPRSLCAGTALYRNNDQEFERLLSRPSGQRKIPVSFSLATTPDGFSLSAEGCKVSIVCEHQVAEKPQRENIERQLSRLGGTPFQCSGVELPDNFHYFIPSSLLSDLRRQWVDAVLDLNTKPVSSNPTAKTGPSNLPLYSYGYLYNISNREARSFYAAQGLKHIEPAFELQPSHHSLLMQCRHCLRYALGYCVKHGGRTPKWSEPLCLRLGDGRRFRLEFDCHHCQMNVYAE